MSTYVDDILKKLNNRGCRMFGLCMGSFMYADDLVLLSPSVGELKAMVDIVCNELSNIDLRLNVAKSVCIRIGKRFYTKCMSISTSTGVI